MAVIDYREDIINGIFAEENEMPLNEQENLDEALEFSIKCSRNNLLARMDAAYALQKASSIRLAV